MKTVRSCGACQRGKKGWGGAGSYRDVDILCAGISRDLYDGPNLTFCSPQKDLWRGENKALPYMCFFVPVLSDEEMLDMKSKLPEYKVQDAKPPAVV